MSAPDRFWREFDAGIAETLSPEQRGEIERVVGSTPPPANPDLGDLRLSFRWFFLRIIWGSEKRSLDRVDEEQKLHAATTRGSWKMAAVVFAAWVLVWLAVAFAASAVVAYFLTV